MKINHIHNRKQNKSRWDKKTFANVMALNSAMHSEVILI